MNQETQNQNNVENDSVESVKKTEPSQKEALNQNQPANNYNNQPSVSVNQNLPSSPPSPPPAPYPSSPSNHHIPPEGTIQINTNLPIHSKKARPKKNIKKILIIVGLVLFGSSALASGGYFGYKFYVKSSNKRVLAKVASNIAASKNMSTNFRVGISGFSVDGEIKIDKDYDMNIKVDNPYFPIDVIYLNDDDKAYLKTPDYSDIYVLETYSSDQINDVWVEYSNVRKAFEKYKGEVIDPSILDPNKNYFTDENLKYFKRVGEEKIDDKKLIKYNFSPDKEYIEKNLKESEEDNLYGVSIDQVSINIDFWIGSNDFKVYKIEGSIKTEVKEDEKEKNDIYSMYDYSTYLDNFELSWEQDFSYDFEDDIKLPEDAEIIDGVDLLKY